MEYQCFADGPAVVRGDMFLLLLRNGGVNSACVSDGFALLMFMPSLARLPVCTGLFKFNALLSSSLKEVGAV